MNSRSRGSKRGPSRAACGRDRPQDARHPAPVTRRRSSADISSRDANDRRVDVTTAFALATSTRLGAGGSSRGTQHGDTAAAAVVSPCRSRDRGAENSSRARESRGTDSELAVRSPRELHAREGRRRGRAARGAADIYVLARGRTREEASAEDLRQVTRSECRASCGQLGRKLPDSGVTSNDGIASSPESPQARFRDFPCLGARGSMDVNPQGWSGTKCHSRPRTERPSTPSYPREANSRKTPVWRSGARAHPVTNESVISSPRSRISNPSRNCSGVMHSGGLHITFHHCEIV